mmetsp:Transcript_18308/g.42384  ORF Transcript_18308/g.42384 Transcript_18308/m.42384 type:complete len:89 (-) Transcript_18308:527-793(-)
MPSKSSKKDVYGRTHPEETPELVEEKTKELEKEVEKLAADNKKGYEEAKVKCPNLLDSDHMLMFLRAEVFNAKACTGTLRTFCWKMSC